MASNSGITREDAVSAAVKGAFRAMETGKTLEPSVAHCAGFAIHSIEYAQAASAGLDNPNISADLTYETMAATAMTMLLALAHFPRFDEVTELKPNDVEHH